MIKETTKLTQEQVAGLIGSKELNEIAVAAMNHPDLEVEKLGTRLIPIVEGNACYFYGIMITNTKSGEFTIAVKTADSLAFINNEQIEVIS
ncbi:MAG: hypothetical protein KAY24_19550 [Candidatus Eisenbacteria sp.]|nr:hypothetical protein [Candidatus Eisenbacteria bacterium]